MVFIAYGGMIVRGVTGSDHKGLRRLGAMTSGIGLFLILLGGFGLLAVKGYVWVWAAWIIIKAVIWFALGGIIVLINRKPEMAQITWWLTILLGVIAILMVVLKPTF